MTSVGSFKEKISFQNNHAYRTNKRVTIQLTFAGFKVSRVNLKELIAVTFVASYRVVASVHTIINGLTFVDV